MCFGFCSLRAETGEPHARWLLLPRPRAARRLCTGTKVGAVGDGMGLGIYIRYAYMYIYPSDPSLLSDRRRSSRGGWGTAFRRAGAGRGTLLPPRPNDLCVCAGYLADCARMATTNLGLDPRRGTDPPPPPRAFVLLVQPGKPAL